jgi:hypothetical protein
MFRSVVWQLVHGQSGGMPWIRIDNNNIIWCYYISWASPLLIFSFMRSKKFSYQEEIREIFKRHKVAFDERYVWD